MRLPAKPSTTDPHRDHIRGNIRQDFIMFLFLAGCEDFITFLSRCGWWSVERGDGRLKVTSKFKILHEKGLFVMLFWEVRTQRKQDLARFTNHLT